MYSYHPTSCVPFHNSGTRVAATYTLAGTGLLLKVVGPDSVVARFFSVRGLSPLLYL